MSVFSNIRERIAKGQQASTGFRYPVYGTGGAYGGFAGSGNFWNDLFSGRLLPGSDFDYVTEAGDLWKNAVISACLNFLLCTFPEPQLVVMRSDSNGEETEIRQHPVLDLLNSPNEDDDDLTALLQAFVIDWNLFGNATWWMGRSGATKVTELQVMPWILTKTIPDPSGIKRISGFAYWVDGKPIVYKPADVLHYKFGRDPRNPRDGLGPLLATCRDICTENELATLAASVARNHGIPSYYIGPDSDDPKAEIADGVAEKLRKLWSRRFSREGRGDAFVSQRKVKIERLGFSPDELMADKSRAVAVSRICAALRIDPMVLGLPSETKTYANLREAHRAVYEHNIIPTGDAFCTRLTRTFRREPGFLRDNERLAFNYDRVGALQEDVNNKAKRAVILYKGGVWKRSEVRVLTGKVADKADEVYITDIDSKEGANVADPANQPTE